MQTYSLPSSIHPPHIILNGLLRWVKQRSVWGIWREGWGGATAVTYHYYFTTRPFIGPLQLLCFLPQSKNMHVRATGYKLPCGCSIANTCLSTHRQPWNEWANWSGWNLRRNQKKSWTQRLNSVGVTATDSMSWAAVWAPLCTAIPTRLFCGALNGGICPLDTTLTWQRL